MRYVKPLILSVISAVALWGCTADSPSGKTSLVNFPGELTKAEYDALSNQQKYAVSNKLLSTMFKGMPLSEFYDLSNGMNNLALSSKGQDLIEYTKQSIATSLTQDEREFHDMIIMGYDDIGGDRSISGKFEVKKFSGDLVDDWPKQQPLARIIQFPLSKQMFDNFVAYVLVNTILFSPAEEIDSTSIRDVQKVFNKLYDDLRQDKTVQQIIARHQRTQENWRRFRSPEDNTREMIEIYLGLFDRDDDVPRAAKACQDLYLTDADQDYELLSTGFVNTEPQYVLDTFVTTCGDFYDVVANHPLVIPRVTTVLVEYFFYTKTAEERANIVEEIVRARPTTFQEIVKSIIFSKEYLLNNERVKSFEENFFGIMHQAQWRPYKQVLQDLTLETQDTSDTERLKASLANMSWPTMTLKLGRFTGVPLDALSFAHYHRALREMILVDGILGPDDLCSNANDPDDNVRITRTECDWREGLGLIEPLEPVHPSLRDDGSGILTSAPLPEELAKYEYDYAEYQRQQSVYNQVHKMSLSEFYDYLFMSVINRRASSVEKADITSLIRDNTTYIREDPNQQLYIYINQASTDRDARTNYDEVARVVFDYLSRLPETYYYRRIK